MIDNNTIEKLFREAYELGLEDVEIYVQESDNFSVKIYEGEIDKYSLSEEFGVSIRGKYDGKMGYAYAEKLEEEDLLELAKAVQENAMIIDSDDEYEIYAGDKEYKIIDNYNSNLDEIDQLDKIEFVKNLEKTIKSMDSRVQKVNQAIYGEGKAKTSITNTKNLNLNDRGNMAYVYASAVFEEGGSTKTAGNHQIGNDFNKFDYEELAKKIVDEGLSKLGAKPVKTGNYEVILRYDAMGDLFSTFLSNFSAESVQKDLSALKGKLGEQIAVSEFNLIDNPHLEVGLASRGYDSEGVATRPQKIIENGQLKTYFHNLKTAKKDGISSTGHAHKSSYKGTLGISPSNLYIEKGEKTREDMMREIGEGLLISDLSGLHSGVNALSGQFSLLAEGYYFKDGKIEYPVDQITIAGNFYDILKNIKCIGNDLEFGMPSGGSYIGTPSIAVGNLVVAGE